MPELPMPMFPVPELNKPMLVPELNRPVLAVLEFQEPNSC